jgi:prepilin-type N-terminal cleavage/methylation domain-containing protein
MCSADNRRGDAGFTLIDIMVSLAVFAILMAGAVPMLIDVTGTMKLGQAVREVERELQTARLKAVTSNRPIRVRFNCPVAGEFRMVELIGTPGTPAAADDDAVLTRCQQSSYPYPAGDSNALTRPNHDGPVRSLHSSLSFGAAETLEFWPDGSVHQQVGTELPWSAVPTTGTAVTVTKGTVVRTITVNHLGKIQLQ